VGLTVGAIAGYFRGWVDAVLMRLTDIFIVIPAIVIAAVVGNWAGAVGVWVLGSMLGFFSWMVIARLVRGEFLSLREREFVEAARVAGASDARIIFRHILPNATGVIIVSGSLLAAGAILLEAAISLLGYGIRSPDVSLGLLIGVNQSAFTVRPWLFWWPALFIVTLALSANIFGDALREAFDPRSRRFSRRRTKERADGVEPDVAAPTSLMDAAAQNPRTGTPTLQDRSKTGCRQRFSSAGTVAAASSRLSARAVTCTCTGRGRFPRGPGDGLALHEPMPCSPDDVRGVTGIGAEGVGLAQDAALLVGSELSRPPRGMVSAPAAGAADDRYRREGVTTVSAKRVSMSTTIVHGTVVVAGVHERDGLLVPDDARTPEQLAHQQRDQRQPQSPQLVRRPVRRAEPPAPRRRSRPPMRRSRSRCSWSIGTGARHLSLPHRRIPDHESVRTHNGRKPPTEPPAACCPTERTSRTAVRCSRSPTSTSTSASTGTGCPPPATSPTRSPRRGARHRG
jgi:ABC-type methionine transport system permease subunit